MSDPFAVASDVRLKAGREASVLRRHPWIYRGALVTPDLADLRPVRVTDIKGKCLGVALPGSSGGALALRMVSWGDQPWNAEVLVLAIQKAAALRRSLALDTDAYRLVHAEGDELPGLVIDCYGDTAVIELFEAAWESYQNVLAEVLRTSLGLTTGVVRKAYSRQGGPTLLYGDRLPQRIEIREGRVRYAVDLQFSQKTGFFIDQRENRRRLAELAGGREILNLFAYSGGFAIAALVHGASRAVNVDSSTKARELALMSYQQNGLAWDDGVFVVGDAFDVTRQLVASGQQFDIVIVDPPAFVKRKSELEGGLRGYKDINLQALRLLRPGGLLFTCSCSALVDEPTFSYMLQAAALDAGRSLKVLERRGAGQDHPYSIFCPETRHLKAWLCGV